MVAQHVEQRRVRVGGDRDLASVHGQGNTAFSLPAVVRNPISVASVEKRLMRVIICGGGVIGTSMAYFLSRRGIRATVIERTGIACAASGKSGGFLARDWCDGTPLAALARHSFDLHAELADRLGDDWGYRRADDLWRFRPVAASWAA